MCSSYVLLVLCLENAHQLADTDDAYTTVYYKLLSPANCFKEWPKSLYSLDQPTNYECKRSIKDKPLQPGLELLQQETRILDDSIAALTLAQDDSRSHAVHEYGIVLCYCVAYQANTSLWGLPTSGDYSAAFETVMF